MDKLRAVVLPFVLSVVIFRELLPTRTPLTIPIDLEVGGEVKPSELCWAQENLVYVHSVVPIDDYKQQQ